MDGLTVYKEGSLLGIQNELPKFIDDIFVFVGFHCEKEKKAKERRTKRKDGFRLKQYLRRIEKSFQGEQRSDWLDSNRKYSLKQDSQ